jgi:hypothetical protein
MRLRYAFDALNAALVLRQSLDDPTAERDIVPGPVGASGAVERRDADLFGSPPTAP